MKRRARKRAKGQVGDTGDKNSVKSVNSEPVQTGKCVFRVHLPPRPPQPAPSVGQNVNGKTNKKVEENLESSDEGPLREEWPEVIMRSFFQHHGVVSQNIESFNKFLTTHINEIVTEGAIVSECHSTEPFPSRHELHFTRVNLDRPKRDEGDGEPKVNLYPNDCLNRSLTYASDIYAAGHIRRYELQNDNWIPVPLSEMELKEAGKKASSAAKRAAASAIPEYEKPFFVYLGKIPVMVRSLACHLSSFKSEEEFQAKRECPLDPGGYFIIGGKERVMVAQEKLPENRPLVYKVMRHSNFECECEVRSSIENSVRPVYALWIRLTKDTRKSVPGKLFQDNHLDEAEEDDDVENSPVLPRGKQFVVVIPKLTKPIPIIILFQALGCSGVSEIEEFVIQGDTGIKADRIRQLLQPSLSLWEGEVTPDQALELIGSLVGGLRATDELTSAECRRLGHEIVCDHVLQHLGTEPSANGDKVKYLCEMIRRVCEVYFGWREYDDRDHAINKRFELPGSLFLQLFKRIWRQLGIAVQKRIKKRLEGKDGSINYDVKTIIHSSTITQGFSYAVSTGNWTDRRGASPSTGVSQELNRSCYVSTLSHLRRVTTPSKLHRNVAARQLHSSSWGMLCANETPEGEPVGLVQNFALSAAITVGCSAGPVIELIESRNFLPLNACKGMEIAAGCKVFVNGGWFGVTKEPDELASFLRAQRRSGKVPSEVSVSMENNAVEIRTDAGRIYRPLMVVEKNELRVTEQKLKLLLDPEVTYSWTDLLNEGIVEELDTAELMNALLAMNPSQLTNSAKSFTHCEIHPSVIMGLSASTVPFAHHNQAPRNTYQSGMAKQAVGLYATNFQQRCDLLAHVMHYPHKPLMSTFGADLCKLWELPAGVECVVAILCYTGYNQEDSLILNQSSIDRGLLRSSVIHTYVDVENQVLAHREQDECFERPSKKDVRYVKTDNYSQLDEDGLPFVGTRIKERDPVIGKTVDCSGTKRDVSMTAKINTNGVVVKAFATTNEDGQRMHKVLLQECRIPKMGDKFASRHGQKGVVGLTLAQEDMPFTREGLVPDVILNPHAIPSRMTIGHIIEALAAKTVCIRPEARASLNATAFEQPVTADTFAEYLQNSGFHKHGEEVFYDGFTGEKLRATVFTGVNYYQRLRHMVDDKLNVRNRGMVTLLEGQPKRGLTRDGAQRFGEMERDCTIAHGAAGFIHERLFTVSDAANYFVCNNCGTLITKDEITAFSAAQKGPSVSPVSRFFRCSVCAAHGDSLSTITLPQAAKLLYQELMSMNIRPRFKTTNEFLTKKIVREED